MFREALCNSADDSAKSSNHNDLTRLHSDGRGRSAAKCAAISEIEAWLLACPRALTLEQRTTIMDAIHNRVDVRTAG